MCAPLEKIYKKSANEILQEFGNVDELPIDLGCILRKIGISALGTDFTELEKKLNKGHILGLVLADNKNAVIYYSKKDTLNRQRFTIAHELGHICKHLAPNTCDYPYIDWRIKEKEHDLNEIEANTFAGELLIPLKKLKEVYLSMELPTSEQLAIRFGVSVNVMEERLNCLGISYYDSKGQAIINE